MSAAVGPLSPPVPPIFTFMNLAAHLDHTLLRPDCTPDQIRQLCQEAKTHQFASVCVPPCYVAMAAQELTGSGVAVGTVIGFPLGYQDKRVKYREAEIAIEAGATELDMVLNIAWLKAGLARQVEEEIEDLADLARVHDHAAESHYRNRAADGGRNHSGGAALRRGRR